MRKRQMNGFLKAGLILTGVLLAMIALGFFLDTL